MASSTDGQHGRRLTARFLFWCLRPAGHSGPCLWMHSAGPGQVTIRLDPDLDPTAVTAADMASAWEDVRALLG